MTVFQYNGDPGRYYPDLRVTVNPGDEVELNQAPNDGRWAPAPSTIKRDVPAEQAVTRPATEEK